MRIFHLIIFGFILIIFLSTNTYADTTYIIKKGDNPSKIAKKFNVNSRDIIRINNLNAYRLKPGTKIIIPLNDKEKAREKNPAKTPADKESREIIRKVNKEDSEYHIVKKGDTLSSLSKKYSISVNDLKCLNNLKSSKLKIGQKVITKKAESGTYIVKKGDSIYKIARRFHIKIDKLREINDLETDLLKPGQKMLLKPLSEQEGSESAIKKENMEDEIKKIAESDKTEEYSLNEKLIILAKKLLNIPYRFGGNSLLGIDCSAFVQKVYSFIGIDLPRSAREQFQEGNPVEKEELSIGDVVFFRTYAPFPSHVGIYLGNNLFIHASSKKKKVTIDSLETPYFFKRFIGAKRFLDIEEKLDLQDGG